MENSKQLATRFIQLAPLMIRAVKAEIREVADGRITHAQYRILSNIVRGNTTVGKIATDQGVSQPSMSKMVEALVQKGLVQRTASVTDRRQISLKLSAKGAKLFEDLKEAAAKNFSQKLKKLSTKQQTDLEKALDLIDPILQKIHEGKA